MATIVAGVNALGRGQDNESLTQFITTIAQTMGPETIMRFINPDEYLKRLAAAQGIDVLNLIKSKEELAEDEQAQAEQAQQQTLLSQAGSIASSPLMDPEKNPEGLEDLQNAGDELSEGDEGSEEDLG